MPKQKPINLKSKFEEFTWGFIKHLCKGLKQKPKVEYESTKLRYVVPVRNGFYLPDFVITFPDGRIRFIEAKGYFRAQDRTKMKLVKEANPDLDIRLLFVRDNKIHKDGKLTYSGWAIKYGFPWSVGNVPKEWLHD